MNPVSALGNVKYTCTICDTTVVGQTRYQQHMKMHRKENDDPMSEQGSISTSTSEQHTKSHKQYSVASANSKSRNEQQSVNNVFKEPYAPVASQVDRKGKKRLHEASSHHLEDEDNSSANSKKSVSSHTSANINTSDKMIVPPSRRSGDPMNPTAYNARMNIFHASDPSLSNLDQRAARARARRNNSKGPRRSKLQQQPSYRPISEHAKEEMRKLLHSSYITVVKTPSPSGNMIPDKEHAVITSLIKKIDKKIRHTMVPVSMPQAYRNDGNIIEDLDMLTDKIDHIIQETIEVELDNFYTKIETQKMKLQLERLRELTRKEAEETESLLGITEEEARAGYDMYSLPALPPALRKYIDQDMEPTYTDDLLKYPGSYFS